jgi:hypothetical protein
MQGKSLLIQPSEKESTRSGLHVQVQLLQPNITRRQRQLVDIALRHHGGHVLEFASSLQPSVLRFLPTPA